MAAGGDLSVRSAINPRKLAEIMPKLMASGGVTMNFAGNEWDNVEFDSINLVLPPAQSPGFLIISHHKDTASAQASHDKAVQRIDNWLKSTDTSSPLAASMRKFISTEKFTVKDSDVVATMDLHAYWDLLFSAIRNATSQPASQQPQEPTNGM